MNSAHAFLVAVLATAFVVVVSAFPGQGQAESASHPCSCSGHGQNPSFFGDRCTCLCNPGFAGDDCDQCAVGFINYPDCTLDIDQRPAAESSCPPLSVFCGTELGCVGLVDLKQLAASDAAYQICYSSQVAEDRSGSDAADRVYEPFTAESLWSQRARCEITGRCNLPPTADAGSDSAAARDQQLQTSYEKCLCLDRIYCRAWNKQSINFKYSFERQYDSFTCTPDRYVDCAATVDVNECACETSPCEDGLKCVNLDEIHDASAAGQSYKCVDPNAEAAPAAAVSSDANAEDPIAACLARVGTNGHVSSDSLMVLCPELRELLGASFIAGRK